MIVEPKTDLLEFELVPVSRLNIENSEQLKITDLNIFVNLYQTLLRDCGAQMQLKELLITSDGIWGLLDGLEYAEVNEVASILVTMYFSLPQKISSAAKSETDEFFYERSFSEFTTKTFQAALSRPMTECRFVKFSYAIEHLENFGIFYLKSCTNFPGFIRTENFGKDKLTAFVVNTLAAIIEVNPVSLDIFSSLSKFMASVTSIDRKYIFDLIISNGMWSFVDLNILLHSLELSSITTVAKCLLEKWANKAWTGSSSFSEQLYFSTVLSSVLSFVSPDACAESNLECLLFEGIGLRLDHSDYQIRLLGMTVAESVNSLHVCTGEEARKLDFELDARNEIVKYIRNAHQMAGEVYLQVLEVGPKVEYSLEIGIKNTDCSSIEQSHSLFKENEPKNSKTKAPIFLNDCIKVLRVNEDPEMVENVMTRLSSVYNSSSYLDRQMNALSVFTTLSALSDKFDLLGFDEERQELMETVLVDHVALIAPNLIADLFSMNKLVLNQKMEYLQVICGATRRVFASKIKLSPSIQASEFLKHFESSLAVLESTPLLPSTKSSNKEAELVQHLFIPLVKSSLRSFDTFSKSHAIFLDKTLWLLAILLSASRNQLQFGEFVDRFLNLALKVSKTDLIQQGPVKTATLLGLSVALDNWPHSMRVIDNYDRLQRIYEFISTLDADAEQSQLLATVVLALETICNPENILKESGEQMNLDFKAIKIQ